MNINLKNNSFIQSVFNHIKTVIFGLRDCICDWEKREI